MQEDNRGRNGVQSGSSRMIQPSTDVLVRMLMRRTSCKCMVEEQGLESEDQQDVGGNQCPPTAVCRELFYRHCGHQPKNSKA